MTETVYIPIATTAVLAVTQLVIWLEIKAATNALHLSTIAAQHEMWSALTRPIGDGDVDSFLLQWQDQFAETAYRARYKGRPTRIKSYILTTRKYLYLYFLWTIGKDLHSPEKQLCRRWIADLRSAYEFRDVHEAQGRRYPEFGAFVDEVLTGSSPSSWLCSDPPVPDMECAKQVLP